MAERRHRHELKTVRACLALTLAVLGCFFSYAMPVDGIEVALR